MGGGGGRPGDGPPAAPGIRDTDLEDTGPVGSRPDDAAILDLDFVRSRFPALDGTWVFLDNGGGSQIVQPVLDRMHEFLTTSNVQLGASYAPSRLASRRLERAQRAVATLLNAGDPDEVVMGTSTTALLRVLAGSVGRTLETGDEIVVTDGDHEANIHPWLELERVGARIRWWRVDPDTGELPLDALEPLMGPRTRLVAMTHASNVLGSINPVRRVADRVHAHGAWLCVDGVGFAPHRAVDVQALGADFYAFSFYKTFGPHHAVLWGRKKHLLDLPGHAFHFIAEDDVPYKFQPGNVNYELSYSIVGLLEYLEEVAVRSGVEAPDEPTGLGGPTESGGRPRRRAVETAFAAIAAHEERLARRLLDFLGSRSGVRIVGHTTADRRRRVPIVSFVTPGRESRAIVEAVDRHHVGIRYGHFYSARLVDALDLPDPDGVVRVSMAHYNTVEEIDRLVGALHPLL